MSEKRKIIGYESFAIWPDEVGVGISKDKHLTEDLAQGVVDNLVRDGFGGEGQIFPTECGYTPIYEEELTLRERIIKAARKQDPDMGDAAMIVPTEYGYCVGASIFVKKSEL